MTQEKTDNQTNSDTQPTEVLPPNEGAVSPVSHQPLVVSTMRLMAFDSTGQPQMVNKNLETTNRNIVDKLLFDASFLPYRGQRIPDPTQTADDIKEGELPRFIHQVEPEFEGLTNGEVAAIKMAESAANGDIQAYKMMVERVAGKAVEKNINVSASAETYMDMINRLATEDNTPQAPHQAPDLDDLMGML